MSKIIIAGGSGNLGKLLSNYFVNQGHDVYILSRAIQETSQAGLQYVPWDGEQLGDWTKALEDADVLINLSGVSINRRFSSANRKLLRDSRIGPTLLLGKAINGLINPPKLWINASGVSLFQRLVEINDEQSTATGQGFLAALVQEWEAAFNAIDLVQTRKIILRISPVLSLNFGMLIPLIPLAKWGLGGHVGNGKQLVSWIHEEDFVAMVAWIMENGTENNLFHACSPNPISNAEFMAQLRNEVGRKLGLPVPKLLAEMGAFFQGVDAGLLLDSVPVTTKLTIENGFKFKFPYIDQAIGEIINRSK
ncbi:TIGR01777 family oxidoreductase [Sphingobacterium sp. HJSM2_6]|uniref:TIGR01777 family oxidoreductase n=1 Tax=Sphingobacterium sp. HJSM2_6 TaxID=3366264 RepID=UPI003BC6F698